MKRILTIAAALALSGCAASGTMVAGRAPYVPVPLPTAGMQRVIGATAGGLTAMFGKPGADIREGTARKLQFESATCVLDAYLYPKGNSEPVVTYIDTRQTDGSPIDRASCVGALTLRKSGGK